MSLPSSPSRMSLPVPPFNVLIALAATRQVVQRVAGTVDC